MDLKAMSEGWEQHLDIRKPLLQKWRKEFARHLCTLGVLPKATGSLASEEGEDPGHIPTDNS
jgi:hypothetical protein